MIQPILLNKNNYHNLFLAKNTNIKNEDQNKNNYSDTFEKRLLNQKEKTNILLSVIAFSAITKTIVDLFSKKTPKQVKNYNLSKLTNDFESLANNNKIPSIENCKSINKNLKDFLQRQINHINANNDLVMSSGNPELSNRLLLYGPAGVGKSFFAKIFAKSLNAEYMEVMYSDYNSVWSGDHINNFKQIFENIIKKAQENPKQKYVVTFNEIDAIIQPADKFSQKNNSSHYVVKLEERAVFLNYLEILKEKAPNVTIIGTTNFSPQNNNLDRAAMSRFQNLVEVPYPDKDCLYEALKMNLDKIKNKDKFFAGNDKNLKELAQKMADRKFSFRNLEYVVNDAKSYHLDENINGKKCDFSFDFLKKAEENLKFSDGELEKRTDKI